MKATLIVQFEFTGCWWIGELEGKPIMGVRGVQGGGVVAGMWKKDRFYDYGLVFMKSCHVP